MSLEFTADLYSVNVHTHSKVPGGGVRYFLKVQCQNKFNRDVECLISIDPGSSISIVSFDFVRANNIRYQEIEENEGLSLYGIFSKCTDNKSRIKIAFITLHTEFFVISFPALVTEPNKMAFQGANILIGND